MSLSEGHTFLLHSYLRFTSYKREQHAREVAQCVEDASDKLPEGEMFSTSEVRQMLAELRGEVDTYVKKEVMNAYHCSALLVKLLMQQGEAAGVALSMDTNALENELLLKEMNSMEVAATTKPASYYAKKPGLGGLAAGSLKGAQQPAAGGQEQLQAEVEALRGRLEALQTANNTAVKDKSTLAGQLEQAKQQLEARLKDLAAAQQQIQMLKAAAGNASKPAAAAREQQAAGAAALTNKAQQQAGSQEQLGVLQKQLRDKEAEVKELQATLSARLQDSKQWLQMKKLMQAKGQEVVALRQRLAKYEPQEVATADAVVEDE